ncbi:tripartite tricarboxylate transporter substrate binding protein [Bradyrhizobium sp. LHD-71]|uniref:Bug family tripartite tricarboxylate transporter substrate binding protein n=1 Tax=Bradyrhizobium sp. LHD-71 TaxID=3072141 RepID=UPI00280D7A13|nr:tripartite tricarboxylate transporter substrate binding protein [Bradyrhizobium sp. LHD-71]MDQ8729212.1 tripartite tricarboxylate transporter substrate binding protein [Bradyrhizobium sp. LHD-71]
MRVPCSSLRTYLLAFVVACWAACPTVAKAQYPSKPISILTSVAPGSPFDLLGRIFAERLRQKLGVPVVLENVTGGQGLIATQRALNASSDGYTLLIASGGLTTSPLVVKNAGYKAEDFVAVAPLGQVPYILFVSSSVQATDVPSLISYMKSNVKNMNSGILMTSHLSMLLSRKFGSIAGGDLTEIGYRGSADMTKALLANDIQLMATTYSVAGPHLASGKIKAIGTVADERTGAMPDLPTFKEKGHPSLVISVWEGLFAKADVPAGVLAKLRAVSQEIVSDPQYLTAMKPTGMEPWTVSFDKLQAAIDQDTERFKRDAEAFKLKLE